MPTTFTLTSTREATIAALELGLPVDAVLQEARRQLVGLFGSRILTADLAHTWVSHCFCMAGREWSVFSHAGVWEVQVCLKREPEPEPEPRRGYEVLFSPRADALIRNLGWDIGLIREIARREIDNGHEEDPWGMPDFMVPIEHVAFKGHPVAENAVEIDLDLWAKENLDAF